MTGSMGMVEISGCIGGNGLRGSRAGRTLSRSSPSVVLVPNSISTHYVVLILSHQRRLTINKTHGRGSKLKVESCGPRDREIERQVSLATWPIIQSLERYIVRASSSPPNRYVTLGHLHFPICTMRIFTK